MNKTQQFIKKNRYAARYALERVEALADVHGKQKYTEALQALNGLIYTKEAQLEESSNNDLAIRIIKARAPHLVQE